MERMSGETKEQPHTENPETTRTSETKMETFNDGLQYFINAAESYEAIASQNEDKDIREHSLQEADKLRKMIDSILSSGENDVSEIDTAIQYLNEIIADKSHFSSLGIQNINGPEKEISARKQLYDEKYRRIGVAESSKTNEEAREDDQNRIREIYEQLGVEPAQKREGEYHIPTEGRLLEKYFDDNFSQTISGGYEESFKKIWTDEYLEHYKQYIKQSVLTAMAEQLTDMKHSDTVDEIKRSKNELLVFQGIMAIKDGFVTEIEDIKKLPFSSVSKKYLDLEVEDIDKKYFQHFSRGN
jgi:hypothetical protein